jgi:predicted acyl esterase
LKLENQRGYKMKSMRITALWLVLAIACGTGVVFTAGGSAQKKGDAGLPSETPARFKPVTDGFDFVRREAMIPMRDKVKLHTVILVPKGAFRAPILLTRTPYNATQLTSHATSSHLGPILDGYDNAADVIVDGGYIRVVQDVRGKYGSEGDYGGQRGDRQKAPIKIGRR